MSNTDKGVVGLILALELASLTLELNSTSQAPSTLNLAESYSHLYQPLAVRGPLTHDPGAPPVASQHNFIVQPLVTKEWNARAF